jgi:hypothetical protein
MSSQALFYTVHKKQMSSQAFFYTAHKKQMLITRELQ